MRFIAAVVKGDRTSGGRAFKCSIGVPIKVSNTDLCTGFYIFAFTVQVEKHITFGRCFSRSKIAVSAQNITGIMKSFPPVVMAAQAAIHDTLGQRCPLSLAQQPRPGGARLPSVFNNFECELRRPSPQAA
jgi:hypothetical protein